MAPNINGLLESSLYVADVAASARYYSEVFGFSMISNFGRRGCAMRAGDKQVLLLFEKGGSVGIQSPHDGSGELHVAFAVAQDDLPRWESWLGQNGIAIEEKRTWDRGGVSIYFRDPDRHLVEIIGPGFWAVY